MLTKNSQVPDQLSAYLSTKDAATYLGVSQGHVRNLVSAGKLPYKKLGHLNRYLKSDLDSLLVEGSCSPYIGSSKSSVYSGKR